MKTPDHLKSVLAIVGNGDGYASLVVRNGRSRIGHIYCEKIDRSFCGVDKRVAKHYDTEVENMDDEFRPWIIRNWGLGICAHCIRAVISSGSAHRKATP